MALNYNTVDTAQSRQPIRAWSVPRVTRQLAGPENWRQNHRFSVAQQFCNCLTKLHFTPGWP